MNKFKFILICCASIMLGANAHANFSNRALMASALFNIPLEDVSNGANYDYNPWGNSWVQQDGNCIGYDGGHSGVDMQTQDVAGPLTADRGFYAISSGEVINDGEDDTFSTIAVFDESRNITTIYLHARTVDIATGDVISVGDVLGIQGSAGVGDGNGHSDAEHVHFEVRNGRSENPACGASTTINPEIKAIEYLIPIISDGDTESDSVLERDWKFYKVNASLPDDANLIVELFNLSDDLDLYTQRGRRPSKNDWNCRPYTGGRGTEKCTIEDSGEWYIGVSGYKAGDFSLSTSLELENSEGLSESLQYIDKCINSFHGYFGNKIGSPYTCFGSFDCQNTSGGNSGNVTKIAVHKELRGNIFLYYWGGWNNLSLQHCN
uniref:Pre-peptidase C-terminal domain-containing protein n=1 Tax=Candidatus Kentrum sp. LFY TaxID=2126342 RepID=A0A450ULW1_9GAMM|nr:MAG: pre-peptidase C-terminal domain-containing protein [Candidatus Kentron sp. LFY]